MVIIFMLLLLGTHLLASLRASASVHYVDWKLGTNYSEWSLGETFEVGDSLIFAFDTGLYNVVGVSSKEYESCTYSSKIGTSSPIAYTLDKAQTFYYICTNYCADYGMKMAVTAGSLSSGGSPPPPLARFPSPPASTSPPTSTSTSTSPSTSFDTSTSHSPSHRKSTTTIVAGVIAALALLALFAAAAYCILIRQKRRPNRKPITGESNPSLRQKQNHIPEVPNSSIAEFREFQYEELRAATNDFDQAQLLGEGGFGKVYRGVLSSYNNLKVAVKVPSRDGRKQSKTEITIGHKVRHKNIVSLIGWCALDAQFILVYDYMENGSLDKHLFPDKGLQPLEWHVRYTIAEGVAEGLAYLHEHCKEQIIHRDIKPENILLGAGFTAHLGDFGVAKSMDEDNEQTSINMSMQGTRGYMAPELGFRKKGSVKCDIYSFGILLLEIVCGERSDGILDLRSKVRDAGKHGRLLSIVDSRLGVSQLKDNEKNEMKLVLSLGLLCSHNDPRKRPTSRDCCRILQKNQQMMVYEAYA